MSKLSHFMRSAERRKAVIEHLPQQWTELEARFAALGAALAAVAQAQSALAQAQKNGHDWLRHELYGLKQTANLAASGRPAGAKIKVIFLIHYIEAWDSLGDIYEAMQAADDFEPIVISVKRRFSGDKNYGFEDIIDKKLSEMGVPHLRFGMENSFEGLDILKALRPDIIFRQSSWEADMPPGYRTAELRFARLCYVPYAAVSAVNARPAGERRDPETDSDLHRAAWKIFYATEDERGRFSSGNAVRNGENLEIVGHPKVKRLLRLGAASPNWPIKQAGGRRFRIIWSPHYSMDKNWPNFGLFAAVYKQILAWVKSDKTIEMALFCPPEVLSMAVSGGFLTEAELTAFLREWDPLPNAARLSGSNYAGLMAASDCMITDGVDFSAEYQFFTKPIIFLERPEHLPLSAAGERIIKGVHPVADMAAAKELAHKFAAGFVDVKAQAQRDNTAWLAGDKLADGSAAERILHSLRRGIEAERR